jgi:hypothetical protein
MMFVLVATVVGPVLLIETLTWAAATTMLQLLVPVAAGDAESTAMALKEKVPAVVGVPMRSPVAGTTFKTDGSDPVVENV